MKKVAYATRGVLVRENKVLCIENKIPREGYYDLPGGGIEEGETPFDTCKREFKEETGINVVAADYKGTLEIETSDSIINLKIFLINKYTGEPEYDLEENFCVWLDIDEFLAKEKLYANSILLNKFFFQVLRGNKEFSINLTVDESDKIQTLNFKYV